MEQLAKNGAEYFATEKEHYEYELTYDIHMLDSAASKEKYFEQLDMMNKKYNVTQRPVQPSLCI